MRHPSLVHSPGKSSAESSTISTVKINSVNNKTDVAARAAEMLTFLPLGRFAGIPLQNLRIALGAGYHQFDDTYVEPVESPPADAAVSNAVWMDITERTPDDS